MRLRSSKVPVDDDDRYEDRHDVHDEREQKVLGIHGQMVPATTGRLYFWHYSKRVRFFTARMYVVPRQEGTFGTTVRRYVLPRQERTQYHATNHESTIGTTTRRYILSRHEATQYHHRKVLLAPRREGTFYHARMVRGNTSGRYAVPCQEGTFGTTKRISFLPRQEVTWHPRQEPSKTASPIASAELCMSNFVSVLTSL